MNRTLNLGGAWELRCLRCSRELPDVPDRISASVPGMVHRDLQAAGVMGDLFAPGREQELAWISECDWVYAREFDLNPQWLEAEEVLLECEGLDTLCTLTLNGQPLGKADNMFRIWRFDARALLRPGTNRLELRFKAPSAGIREHLATAATPETAFKRSLVEPRAFLRKGASTFGWDWSPKFTSMGIWRPIRLVARSGPAIADVQVYQNHRHLPEVTLDVQVRVTGSPGRCAAVIRGYGAAVEAPPVVAVNGECRLALRIPDAQLWWPNGLGPQCLYELEVCLLNEGGEPCEQKRLRIGLRTFELLREQDSAGESFQFSVNGQPFFAKGSNWINADLFYQVDPNVYRNLLEAAAEAHHNMIRIWGGATYEADLFYELCDELGIAVWQDFMFACCTVPAYDDAWLEEVRREVVDNVARLRNHSCIALWCGNNELEAHMVMEVWTDQPRRFGNKSMGWGDYDRLFNDLIPEVLRDLDPETPYWPCSPHSPFYRTVDPAFIYDKLGGDIHHWKVLFDGEGLLDQRKSRPRFVSETGFTSLPHESTLKEAFGTPPSALEEPLCLHLQRIGNGNATVMRHLKAMFSAMPECTSLVWATQLLHGVLMKVAAEHWRSLMPHTAGMLYWMLNDCWPGFTNSTIDVAGRWKLSHYFCRRFFAPQLLCSVVDEQGGRVQLRIVNDSREAVAATLRSEVWTTSGERLSTAAEPVTLSPMSVTSMPDIPLPAAAGQSTFLRLTLEGPGGVLASEVACAELILPEVAPQVSITPSPVTATHHRLTVTTDRPSFWTTLDFGARLHRLSDNCFHLMPGERVTLDLHLEEPATPEAREAIMTQLRITSLFDHTPAVGGRRRWTIV